MSRPLLSRRDWLRLSAAGVLGSSVTGWLPRLAADLAADPRRRRACILLWMDGGPSQTDTFDLKPSHPNGGLFKAIPTNVAGIQISEHLPNLAKQADKLAIVRSMSTREGDHSRAALVMHTGYTPAGEISYPSIGGLLARELGRDDMVLPQFICIAPNRGVSPQAFSSGFLGPRYAPLIVGNANNLAVRPRGAFDYETALRVPDLEPARQVRPDHADSRIEMLQEMDRDFARQYPGTVSASHQSAYERAVKLMRTAAAKAFNLEEEKSALRDAYGRNLFGQSCLLARRLVEQGVPFIEINLGGVNGGSFGWDTHGGNFDAVKNLSGVLDPAWAALLSDLKERGLLDSTVVAWMGEFGRTPRINPQQGRDHFPTAWSTVLAGGGIKGGQVVGATSADGMTIKDRPVTTPDFLATLCHALGVDASKQNQSNVGRPIRIVDKAAKPIQEILA
jgi:hypothetical protein